MIKIDFVNLLNSYENNLLDNLRGFGKDKDYLKFWVPGTTSASSFFNLVDALAESQIYLFKIFYKKSFFNETFTKEILLFLEKVGEFEQHTEDNTLILDINIIKENYERFIKNKNIQSNNSALVKIDKKKEIIVYKSDKKIEKFYEDNLKDLISNEYYSVENLEGPNVYQALFNNYQIYFLIDDKVVNKLSHTCRNESTEKRLLNALMDLCINKNIQEVSDHAIIYLEERIRLLKNSLIKPGIILPSHAGIYFDDLQKIIREIFSEYARRNNIKFNINKNYFKKSYIWVNLNYEDKVLHINKILEKIKKKFKLSNESIVIQSIDNNFKINLRVNNFFKNEQKKYNILLEIESNLKDLDNTLEVFVDEILDQNKLRLKNSPQTKLLI
jgi:hypothetical protein